jgi:mannose-6-phosphate isomerase-like protein (cupin superfamily)
MPPRFVFPPAAALPSQPGRPSARVFAHGSFEARRYAPRGADAQAPHDRDAAHVLVRGRGAFPCAGARAAFGPGDLPWVPAGAGHRCEDVSGNLAVRVVFHGPEGGEG